MQPHRRAHPGLLNSSRWQIGALQDDLVASVLICRLQRSQDSHLHDQLHQPYCALRLQASSGLPPPQHACTASLHTFSAVRRCAHHRLRQCAMQVPQQSCRQRAVSCRAAGVAEKAPEMAMSSGGAGKRVMIVGAHHYTQSTNSSWHQKVSAAPAWRTQRGLAAGEERSSCFVNMHADICMAGGRRYCCLRSATFASEAQNFVRRQQRLLPLRAGVAMMCTMTPCDCANVATATAAGRRRCIFARVATMS